MPKAVNMIMIYNLAATGLTVPANPHWTSQKSAHTALAVKACLLGCNLATLNAQVTFVYIAVAISALAGGATQNFRTETLPLLVFS